MNAAATGLSGRWPSPYRSRRPSKGGGLGQLVLAIAPRNFLDHHRATVAALDAPHTVQEENQSSPEGDELEAPLGKLIVARGRLVAPRENPRFRRALRFSWLIQPAEGCARPVATGGVCQNVPDFRHA